MRTFALMMALLAVFGAAHAADDDPEPPRSGARSLKALQGKWDVVQRISKGQTTPFSGASYTFDGAKVTYTYGKGKSQTMTATFDPKRPGVLTLQRETVKKGATTTFFFEIEKGKLYLAPDRGTDPNAKADFQGNTTPVIVLEKDK